MDDLTGVSLMGNTIENKILERLNQCYKDKNNQPLVCYGCSHSACYMTYTDDTLVEGTDFPGMPSGERPCCFCIRNINRGFEVDKWYDQSEPIKVPMDCYHSYDMLMQINKWDESK